MLLNLAIVVEKGLDAFPVAAINPENLLTTGSLGVGMMSAAADDQRISLAGTEIHVIHAPGHSPGAICLYLPEADALLSGDSLFSGGPGTTGRSYSDFPTIIGSVRDRLLTLPEQTAVHTGHGEITTIGSEAPHLSEWIARGF